MDSKENRIFRSYQQALTKINLFKYRELQRGGKALMCMVNGNACTEPSNW